MKNPSSLSQTVELWDIYLVNGPFAQAYTYSSEVPLKRGQVVEVPFGRKRSYGVVWQPAGSSPVSFEIKAVYQALPFFLPEALLHFAEGTAHYTLTPLGKVLKAILPIDLKTIDTEKKEIFAYQYCGVPLTDEQEAALQKIRAHSPATFLLDGVTGSGKTEVYFAEIAALIAQDPQAQILILLPEIFLTTQWMQRFETRFQALPTVWHSHLTPAVRRRAFQHIYSGSARVIVGARSAIFLPFHNLKFIIVDEEHDAAYKQEDEFVYQGRDLAIVRGKIEKISVLLSSATPSLETYENVQRGKYQAIPLHSRYQAPQARMELIDLRHQRYNRLISYTLQAAIESALQNQQQVLLFLNRRGYAPLTLCRSCGHRFVCGDCQTAMVYHQSLKRLLCHQCGYCLSALPADCPQCQEPDSLLFWGPGVEKIAEEVEKLFPAVRYHVISSDTLPPFKERAHLFEDLYSGHIPIIIGTQMMAKGHHLPNLSLVGVIDADYSLNNIDFRAAEHTYQLLHQVAGRAGREKTEGKFLLQTYSPHHPLFQALAQQKRAAFLDLTRQQRQQMGLPPYARSIAIIISAPQESVARQAAQRFHAHCLTDFKPPFTDWKWRGPIPAPFYYRQGRYRWRSLIQLPLHARIHSFLEKKMATFPAHHSVRIKMDVDPYSFL